MPPKKKRKGVATTPAKPKSQPSSPGRHSLVTTSGEEFTVHQYLGKDAAGVPFPPLAEPRTYQIVGVESSSVESQDSHPQQDRILILKLPPHRYSALLRGLSDRSARPGGDTIISNTGESTAGEGLNVESAEQKGFTEAHNDSAIDLATPVEQHPVPEQSQATEEDLAPQQTSSEAQQHSALQTGNQENQETDHISTSVELSEQTNKEEGETAAGRSISRSSSTVPKLRLVLGTSIKPGTPEAPEYSPLTPAREGAQLSTEATAAPSHSNEAEPEDIVPEPQRPAKPEEVKLDFEQPFVPTPDRLAESEEGKLGFEQSVIPACDRLTEPEEAKLESEGRVDPASYPLEEPEESKLEFKKPVPPATEPDQPRSPTESSTPNTEPEPAQKRITLKFKLPLSEPVLQSSFASSKETSDQPATVPLPVTAHHSFVTLKLPRSESHGDHNPPVTSGPDHSRINSRSRGKRGRGTTPSARSTPHSPIVPVETPKLEHPIMAPVKDPNDVSTVIKDVIDTLYDVQSKTHGYIPETQDLLFSRMLDLQGSLTHLRELTDTQISPNNPVHDIHVPPEIVDYVDEGRNPDIYTREIVESVQRGNAVVNGKKQAFRDFSVIFAKKLKEGIGGVDKEVDRLMEQAGLGQELAEAMKKDENLTEGARQQENGQKT